MLLIVSTYTMKSQSIITGVKWSLIFGMLFCVVVINKLKKGNEETIGVLRQANVEVLEDNPSARQVLSIKEKYIARPGDVMLQMESNDG